MIFKKVQSIIELHFVNGDIKIGSRSISTTHLRVEIVSAWMVHGRQKIGLFDRANFICLVIQWGKI